MTNEREPLWSDERIEALAGNFTDELDGGAGTYHLFCVAMGNVRDDYEARIAELEQKLSRAAQYKGAEAYPCPLCRYEDGIFVESCAMHNRIAELEARLAQTWQPLPDGYFQSSITNGMYAVSTRSDSLECYMAYMGEWKYICSIELPDNIRLCHLVERAEVQPPQAHEREIIEAMVEDWLQLYEPGSNEWADAQVIVSWLNNYRGTFADDLRQQVTERAEVQPYSHRNGETEPPTVNGWYAYNGAHRNAKFGGKVIAEGVTSRGFFLVDGDEYYRFVWEGDDDQTIADYTGRWYGPIVPPWEADHE